MLPDLPGFKVELRKQLERIMQTRTLQHAPLVGRIKVQVQDEGDRYSHETHEGDIEEKPFKTVRIPITIPLEASPDEQQAVVAEKLDEASRSLARQQEQMLFTTIKETTEHAGTTFNAAGRPFDVSMFLDTLELVQLDFDSDGKPKFPTIVMHPGQMKHVAPLMAKWQSDPKLMARLAALVGRKKEEWRAREADRKLVG